jgi:hypothetical protein
MFRRDGIIFALVMAATAWGGHKDAPARPAPAMVQRLAFHALPDDLPCARNTDG